MIVRIIPKTEMIVFFEENNCCTFGRLKFISPSDFDSKFDLAYIQPLFGEYKICLLSEMKFTNPSC